MTAIPPLMFGWDGEAMVPKHPRLADRHYVVGQTYNLEVREDRSVASHRFYFASIQSAHDSLPDDLAQRYPSPEHLRKHALIAKGYCDQRTHVCSSKAEALKLASFLAPVDTYAIISVNERVVTFFTAKSQSVRAMPRGEFQRSKDDVLDFIAGLIGTTTDALAEAGQAA